MSGSSSLVDRRVVHRAWVDSIPAHWDVVSLRWCAIRFSGGTPSKDNDDFWEGGDIPWLNSGAVNAGLIVEASDFITEAAYLSSSAKWVPKDALVIALAGQGKTKGMVAQLGFAATCNQSMAAIVPSRRIDSRYLYWWLVSNYSNIRNMAGGEARDGLNLEMIGSIPCLVPPLEDQAYIAAHLDRETAKIDTLIAKKRELVAKLKEQRNALISRTVTRGLPPEAAQAAGLDPNPPMKDSGVKWLGEVPGHWTLTKFSRGVYIEEGQIDPEDIEHRDSIMIAPNHIESGTGRLIAIETADEQGAISGKYRCQAGDVVYSKIRPALRKVVVVDADCLCSADMYPLRPGPSISARYFWYFLLTDQFTAWAKLESDRVAMPKINRDSINQIQIPTPPMTEQVAIENYLIEQTRRLDALLERIETAIARLTEYRAALITAAVTGQINVR